MCLLLKDNDPLVRSRAVGTIGKYLKDIINKDQAWNELYLLVNDSDIWVRKATIKAIAESFEYLPDKTEAMNVLLQVSVSKNIQNESKMKSYFNSIYVSNIINKQNQIKLQIEAIKMIAKCFEFNPLLDRTSNVLQDLVHDENESVQLEAIETMTSVLSYLPNKNQWNIIIKKLILNEKSISVKLKYEIGNLFKLNLNKNIYSQLVTINALGNCFQYLPNENEAWQDIQILLNDTNNMVKVIAIDALGNCFQYLPNKDEAWQNLQIFLNKKNMKIKVAAIDALGNCFQHLPNKDEAWHDLYTLTKDKNINVKIAAINALGNCFQHVPNKDEAWQCLHSFNIDKSAEVRCASIDALGNFIQHLPNKDEALQDLFILTEDESNEVKKVALRTINKNIP